MTDAISDKASWLWASIPDFTPASDLLRYAEAEVAAMKRTGVVDERRFGFLLAIAQDAIGDFQRAWMIPRIRETFNETLATPLIRQRSLS